IAWRRSSRTRKEVGPLGPDGAWTRQHRREDGRRRLAATARNGEGRISSTARGSTLSMPADDPARGQRLARLDGSGPGDREVAGAVASDEARRPRATTSLQLDGAAD